MKNQKIKNLIGGIIFIGIIYVIGWGYPAHERHVHLLEGWVEPTSWNCPTDHPIKANLRSMIYHLPGDPYWNSTDALNGECFDTPQHAEQQGFRHILR